MGRPRKTPLAPTDKRLSPEHKEHLKRVGKQKGCAKTGGKIALPAEVKEAMSTKTLDAVEIVYDLMMNSSNDMARLKAAEYLLNPFVSKAPTEANVTVNHNHAIADMLSQINQARLKDDSKTIDITPTVIAEDVSFVTVNDEDEEEDA